MVPSRKEVGRASENGPAWAAMASSATAWIGIVALGIACGSQASGEGNTGSHGGSSGQAGSGGGASSLATFAIANDPRLTTTMHLDGGTMSPHTDAMNLVKPAAFICGDSGGDGLITGDLARPNCDIDFQNATTPVGYGDIVGASHLTITGSLATDPKLKAFLTATAGWLRWQLAAAQTIKALFVPSSTCTLCTQMSVWTVQEKNIP